MELLLCSRYDLRALHPLTLLILTPTFDLGTLSELVSKSHSVMSDSLQPHGLWPARLLCPWNSPGKNTGVGHPSLLQRIFPTQGLNLDLLHCRQILYCLSHHELNFILQMKWRPSEISSQPVSIGSRIKLNQCVTDFTQNQMTLSFISLRSPFQR